MATIVESDTSLLEKARLGDQSAFRVLVERHEPAVAATVIGMIGRTDEAKDVGLDVFVRFHRSLGQFRGEANLRTYLTRIAINLSLNEIRRRNRHTQRFDELNEQDTAAESPTPEGSLLRDERDSMVRRAIQSLDPSFRQVVVLRMIQGMSVRETAETLDIPSGTVLSRLSRAQEKLRTLIKPLLENYDEHS